MFGMPSAGAIEYSELLELDLATVTPAVAGPKRPQDRIELPRLKETFRGMLLKPLGQGGYGRPESELGKRFLVRTGVNGTPDGLPLTGGGEQDPETVPAAEAPLTSAIDTNPETELEMVQNRPTPDRVEEIPPGEFPRAVVAFGHGDVAIAAITSCT